MCPTPNGSCWSHTFRSHSTLVVSAFEGLRPYDPTEMTGGFEQDPEAETEIQRGTAVDLVVSTGPAQELTPSASPCAENRKTIDTRKAAASGKRAGGPRVRENERFEGEDRAAARDHAAARRYPGRRGALRQFSLFAT
jgi:hypothetical protein